MRHRLARGFAAAVSISALAGCAADSGLDSLYAEEDWCFQTTSARFGTGTQIGERDLYVLEYGAVVINEPGGIHPRANNQLFGDRFHPFITLCATEEDQVVTITASSLREDEDAADHDDTAITRRIQAGACKRFPEGDGQLWYRSADWLFGYSLDVHTEVTFNVTPERDDEGPFQVSFWLDEDYRVEPNPQVSAGPIKLDFATDMGHFTTEAPACLRQEMGYACFDIELEDVCANEPACMPHHTDSGLFDGCRPSCDRMSETLCGVRDDCAWAGTECAPMPSAPRPQVETEEPVDG